MTDAQRFVSTLAGGLTVIGDGEGGVNLVWYDITKHLTPLQCAELTEVLDGVVSTQ
jgi:hypothetical protein